MDGSGDEWEIMEGDKVSGCEVMSCGLSGPHMSPVFIPYKHTSMQNKITFMKLRGIRILMMVFLYFFTTTVNTTYGGFYDP
jgi:hypothetical protein